MKSALTILIVLLFLSVTNSQTIENTFYNLEDAFKNPSKVVKLDLSNQGLTALPDSIDRFRNMKSIDLSGNYISQFPGTFSKLKKLETVDISDNEFNELPFFLPALKRITSIDVSGNSGLSASNSIDILTELKKLKKLKISGNENETIPDVLFTITSLKELYLSYPSLKFFPEQIANLKKIEIIGINSSLSICYDSLADKLSVLKKLSRLELTNCMIDSLSTCLLKFENLSELNLSGNNIQSADTVLSSFKNLKLIDLTANPFKRNDFFELSSVMPNTNILYDRELIEKRINPPFNNVLVEPQEFVLNSNNDTSLVASSGTKITVLKNAFVDQRGNVVTGEVDLVYEEYANVSDVFLSGIPMSHAKDGIEYPFSSAGMFSLTAFKNGEPLELNNQTEGAIRLDFMSNNPDPDMNEYYYDEETNEWVETKSDNTIVDVAMVTPPMPPQMPDYTSMIPSEPKLVIPAEPKVPVFDYTIYRSATYISFAQNNSVNSFRIAVPDNPRGEEKGKYHYKSLKELKYLKKFILRCDENNKPVYEKFKRAIESGKVLTDIRIDKYNGTNGYPMMIVTGNDTFNLVAEPYSIKSFNDMFHFNKYQNAYKSRMKLWNKIDERYMAAKAEFQLSVNQYYKNLALWKDSTEKAEKRYAELMKQYTAKKAESEEIKKSAEEKYNTAMADYNKKMVNFNNNEFTYSYDPEKISKKIVRRIEPIRLGICNMDRLLTIERKEVLAKFIDKNKKPVVPEFIYVLNDYLISVSVFFGNDNISYIPRSNSRLIILMADNSYATVSKNDFSAFLRNKRKPIKVEMISPNNSSPDETIKSLASR